MSASGPNHGSVEDDKGLSSVTGSVGTSRRALIAFARSGHERSVSSLTAPMSKSSSGTKSSSSDTSSPLLSSSSFTMVAAPTCNGSELPSLALVSSSSFSATRTAEGSDELRSSNASLGGAGNNKDDSSDSDVDFGFTKVHSARGRGSPLIPSALSPPPMKSYTKVPTAYTDPSSPTAMIPPFTASEYDNAEWRFRLKSSELCIDASLNPVAVYVIEVFHGDESWEIVRRFRQFYELDVQLRYIFPGNNLPKLPRKYLFKSGTDPLLVKERTTLLQRYISELGANPQVADCGILDEWVAEESAQVLFRLTQPILSGSLLRKRSMRLGKRCFFVLTRELMVYYDGDRPKSLLEPPARIILLDGATLRVNKDMKTFTVTGKNGTSWTLESRNAEEASAWTTFIESSIKALADAKKPMSERLSSSWEAGVVSAQMKSSKSLHSIRTGNAGREIRSTSFEASRTKTSDPTSSSTSSGPQSPQDTEKITTASSSAATANTTSTSSSSSTTSSTTTSTATNTQASATRPALTTSHVKTSSLAVKNGISHQDSDHKDDISGVHFRTRSDSLPSCATSSALDSLPGEPMKDFIEKERLKALFAQSDLDSEPKRLTVSAFSMSTQNLPSEFYQDLPSRPRGATMMFSSGTLAKPATPNNGGIEDAALKQFRGTKEAVDKDLRYLLQSMQSLEAFQSRNNGKQSEVTRQLIDLIKTVIEAKPEDLLTSTLCKDTVVKIQQVGKHPMTIKLLFTVSSLARFVDAYKSQHRADQTAAAVSQLAMRSPRSVPRREAPQSPQMSATGSNGSPTKISSVASDESLPSPRQPEPKPAEDKQAVRQPLGELHIEPVSGPPNPRPEKRGIGHDSSSGSLHHHKSLRSSAKKVMCRICEEEYPQSTLKEHTKFCMRAANADSKDARCNERIVNMLKLLEAHRQRVVPKGTMKDTYRNIVTLSANACAIQYGKDVEVRTQQCLDILAKLQGVQVELTYDDVGLVTYLRRLIRIIEEKYGNLKEFSRLQKESEKDKKRQVNRWGLLSLIRPHMQEPEPDTTMDELLLHNKTRVSIDDFEIIKRISSGAYGKVYLARKKKTRDLFAVKVQNKSDLLRKNMADSAIGERKILSNVKTPFVVTLYYAFQSDKALFLVMEYCPGGDVATLLHNLGAFDTDMARVYAAETVMSVESLHKMSYIHRDLKPDNLLVNEKGHLLLTDFGLSSIGVLDEQSQQSPSTSLSGSSVGLKSPPMTGGGQDNKPRIVGTPDYLAPEMLLGTGHGPEVDWWALGVMIYEFLTGVPPFNAETPEDIFDRILRRDLIWPEDMEPEARDIIDKLLNPDASQRLGHNGADEVKSHPFFAGINWDTLLQESREDIFVPQLDNPEDTSYHEDHRQRKGGSSMETPTSFSGQDFQGFEFFNTESLFERTLQVASEENDDDDEVHTPTAVSPAGNGPITPTTITPSNDVTKA